MFFNLLTTETTDSLKSGATATVDSLATGKMTIAEIIEKASSTSLGDIISTLGAEIVQIVFKIIIALVILGVGKWLIGRVEKIMMVTFEKRNIDLSLRSFLRSIVKVILYVLLVLTIIQLLGINTTSLVAMLASAGLAIGMALSGTLQNFAGGVMVLFLKPYRVGDYITAQDQSGTVREILLFTTILDTPDGRTIFLPNSTISSSIIDNYSHAGVRRAEWSVGISYGDDYAQAKEAIMEIVNAEKRIINDPAKPAMLPFVGLKSMDDSAVQIVVRGWTKSEDYWDVFFLLNEKFYSTLPTKGVNFPFPQLDVHIKNQ